jgi:SSS family solute:Na+ symporter
LWTVADWYIIVVYFIFVITFGLYTSRLVKTLGEYWLAGHRMPWWAVGISSSSSEVDTGDVIGVAGAAYSAGLPSNEYVWGAAVASAVSANTIYPALYKSGVNSNAEWLGKRYNSQFLRIISPIFQIINRCMVMGTVVYGMATVFMIILGVELWTAVIAGCIASLVYVFFGGIISVIMVDVVQYIFQIIMLAIVGIMGFIAAGGFAGIAKALPQHMTFFVPPGPGVEFSLIAFFIGIPIMEIAYMSVLNYQAQKFLTARNEWNCRMGALFAYIMKIPWTLFTMFIGLSAAVLVPGLERADYATGKMLMELLPTGLIGLFVASLISTMVDTIAGCSAGMSVVFTNDLWKSLRPKADEKELLRVSRIFHIVFITFVAIFGWLTPRIAPLLWLVMMKTHGLTSIPFLTIFLLGAVWAGAKKRSAIVAWFSGYALAMFLTFAPVAGIELPWFLTHWAHIPIYTIVVGAIVLVCGSIFEQRSSTEEEQTRAYVAGTPKTSLTTIQKIIEQRIKLIKIKEDAINANMPIDLYNISL